MEKKQYYKMYKSGKQWCCMALTALAVMTAGVALHENAQADTTTSVQTEQISTSNQQVDNNQVETKAGSEINDAANEQLLNDTKTTTVTESSTVNNSVGTVNSTVPTEKNGWYDENGQKVYYQNGQTKSGQDYAYLESMTNPQEKNWYMVKDGVALSGLQKWYGTYYYFDPVTYLKVTDTEVPVKWTNGAVTPYRFDQTGALVQGLYTDSAGHQYYSDPSTYLVVKNQRVDLPDGSSMIFGPDGQALKGLQHFGNALYYLDPATGRMVKHDYRTFNNDMHGYLFGENGQAQTGLQEWYGTYYYFDPTTYQLVTNQYLPVHWANGDVTWYRFGKTGSIYTGLYRDGQALYYFDPSTYLMVKNDFRIAEDGQGYMFGSDGKAISGLQKWYGTYYYFDPETYQMAKNQMVDVKWSDGNVTPYMFGNTGSIIQGLYTLNGKTYYFDPVTYLQVYDQIANLTDGSSVLINPDGTITSGLHKFDNGLYYTDESTHKLVKNDFRLDTDGNGYMFGNDGKAVSGLQKWYGSYYYFDPTSYRMVRNQYLPISWANGDVTWYRFGSTGSIYTGLYKDANGVYYFDPSTYLMVKNDFRIAEDGNGYMFGNDGKAISGLQKWYGTYYYFDPVSYQMVRNNYIPVKWANGDTTWYMFGNTGSIVTGPCYWYGSLYYFDPNTYEKVTNKWINNVYFNETGSGEDHTNDRLQNVWAGIINGQPGHIGIAIHSQFTGKTYSYTNASGYRWLTASTVKVAVLSELLHRTNGNLDGNMQALATQMIRYSDNNATTAICNNYLGGVQGMSNLYRALGMNSTGTTSTWGSTLTTPEDQLKLLDTIYLSNSTNYLDNNSKNYIKYQMHNVSAGQNWGISSGSGDFYIKNGWIPYGYMYINSIGFIPGGNWSGYTIAVYTDGQPGFQSAINVIERLARATKGVLQG